MPVRLIRVHCATVLLAALLALLAIPAARAQQAAPPRASSLDALAAKMAESIARAKEKSVVVLDFIGPGKGFSALGQTIAQEFSSALAKSAARFIVIDPSKVSGQERRFSGVDYADVGFPLADNTEAKAAVLGRLSLEGDAVVVAVDCYRLSDRARIAGFKVAVPVADDMKPLIDKSIGGEDPTTLPRAGKDGYTMPSCIHCPEARMTEQEAQHLVKSEQGPDASVILTVVVAADGIAKDIQVSKQQPYGLTSEAIATVLKWRFKPATGPDGKPAEVQIPIEVQFHLQ